MEVVLKKIQKRSIEIFRVSRTHSALLGSTRLCSCFRNCVSVIEIGIAQKTTEINIQYLLNLFMRNKLKS